MHVLKTAFCSFHPHQIPLERLSACRSSNATSLRCALELSGGPLLGFCLCRHSAKTNTNAKSLFSHEHPQIQFVLSSDDKIKC